MSISQTENDIKALQTHVHACSLYSDNEQQKRQFVPYIQSGLLLGEQCIYFLDHNTPEFVLEALQENGFNAQPYLDSQALSIVKLSDITSAVGSFSASKLLTYWSSLLAHCEREGFAGFRATGEMTWALHSEFNLKALTAYESQLNKFAIDRNVSFLCQYHRDQFPANKLKDVISVHPVIIDKDTVLDNPAHIRDHDFGANSAEAHLQATLDTLSMAKVLRQTNDELMSSIAEQKRLQKELQRLDKERQDRESVEAERRQYRLIAETIPQVVWTTNADGIIEYFNPFWYRYTGMLPENALPKGWIKSIHPDDLAGLLESWRHCQRTGESYQKEYRFKAADGSYAWYLAKAVPMRDRQGNIVEWFGVSVDIHEHKTLSQTLAAQRDKAEEATRTKSIFLANMSHEIRTPMNAIIGMSNILLKTNLDECQSEYAGNIREAAISLLSVINDILDFSKVEAGKVALEVVAFNLTDLIENTCGFLSPSAGAKGVSIVSHIDSSIPGSIFGDPEKIRQIIVNLASNSMKFSDHGDIVIRADLQSKRNDMVNVRFSVTDQGIGMSDEVQSRLFKPFVQADPSIAAKFGGSGLGLSICKSLVELMNGEIGIESAPGKGACIWFSLPLQRSTESQVAARQKDKASHTNNAIKPLRKELILIVEDYPINQQVAKLYLCDLGFSSHITNNGKEAIKALKETRYDLILMDCQMPEMDGFAATSIIRETEALTGRHIPIIAMTAHAMGGDRERCIAAGHDDYISKPVDPEELRAKLEKFLPAPGNHQTDVPVALDRVHSRYGEISERLLRMFFANAPRDVKNLKSAFDDQDHKSFIHTVHGFKGVCSTVFASQMKDTCVTIESAARESKWDVIPDLLQQLEMETTEMQEFLEQNLSGMST
ncbi:MAG: MEDS domain-containing protein [Candidatus Obscuribacterales bacterium]|nr:MEDS domain-containing protein [Candidatus Obscuribacterales bacterium]